MVSVAGERLFEAQNSSQSASDWFGLLCSIEMGREEGERRGKSELLGVFIEGEDVEEWVRTITSVSLSQVTLAFTENNTIIMTKNTGRIRPKRDILYGSIYFTETWVEFDFKKYYAQIICHTNNVNTIIYIKS